MREYPVKKVGAGIGKFGNSDPHRGPHRYQFDDPKMCVYISCIFRLQTSANYMAHLSKDPSKPFFT